MDVTYNPQANDQICFEGKTVSVVSVGKDSVSIIDVHGNAGTVTTEQFDKMANGSIARGATVVRGGKQIIPHVPDVATPSKSKPRSLSAALRFTHQ